MRLSLTGAYPRAGTAVDLELEVEPETPVREIVAHLAQALDVPASDRSAAFVNGERLGFEVPLSASRVVEGVEIDLGTPRTASAVRPWEAHPSLRIVSGLGAGAIAYLSEGTVVLGRDPSCTVRLQDPTAPPIAAVITVAGGQVMLEPVADADIRYADAPVTAPVLLAPEVELQVGDTLLELALPAPSDAAVTRSASEPTFDFARPPRLLPPKRTTHFRLPPPPGEAARRPLPWISVIAPLVVSVGTALLFKNPSFLAFAVLSPVMLLANYWNDRKTGRVSHRQRLKDYDELTARIRAEADAAMAVERVDRRRKAPDPALVLETATAVRARLWVRRRDDDDYLSLRIGTADLPSDVVVDDPEELEHRRQVAQIAGDVPVEVRLRERGVIGIAGPAPGAQSLAGWLLGQLAVLQSPHDTQFVLLTGGQSAAHWEWSRWMPHLHGFPGQTSAASLGNDAESVGRRVAELGRLLDRRRSETSTRDRDGRQETVPDVVVVIDGARRLRALPGLARILRDGPAAGVYAICLDADPRLLPEECTAVVRIEGSRARLVVQREDAVDDIRLDLVSPAWLQRVARAVAPLVDVNEDAVSSALPGASRLVDVLKLDPPSPSAILDRWRQGGATTQLVVGESVDGAFSFDLRRDGPHGLVAGTTGSGKSELLQTIVASLAVANRPDAMTFVLVDYKGGAAFKDAVHLPHTVGMVTDLDPHLVERALASLGAELRRRERLLARVGAKDLDDYAELAGADAGIPSVPRLLIVIDEFASLVRELPEFVTGLVNVAQRGRSLGIHLILATQRPQGVVTPEIRANTNLRIALRVTDAGESVDVVGAPDAARISKNTPGRGYISLGAGALLPFQSARVGGRRRTAAAKAAALWSAPLEWHELGARAPEPPRAEAVESTAETDLQALVAAIGQASETAGIPAQHRPWLEPLPEALLLEQVNEFALPAEADGIEASVSPLPFGLQDFPAEQRQQPALFDLDSDSHLMVAGAARSGRSQFLRTLAAAIATNTTTADVHLYALDCGNGALVTLDRMPQVGAVVLRGQTDRATRLLDRLTREAQRRQDAFAATGVAGITEQRRTAAPAERLPHIVLMIDRWEGFLTALGTLDGGARVEQVTALVREGASLGIHVVITGDRQLLTHRISTLIENKILLRLSDRGDYTYGGLNARQLPEKIADGRGFTAGGGTETQIALLSLDASGQAQSEALARIAETAAARDAAKPEAQRPFRLDLLPASITLDDAWQLRRSEHGPLWALVGVGGDQLTALGPELDAGPGTFLAAGPPKSGRSTLLAAMSLSLLQQGARLVIIAPRPSPLRELAGHPGVLAVLTTPAPEAAELAELMPADAPNRVLVIDDAELVKDAAKPWFSELVKTAADRHQALVIAGTTGEVAGGLTGWQVDMKRNRVGAVLAPQSVADGEVIGIRLPQSALASSGGVGRALLKTDSGDPVSVQVPTFTPR